MQASRGDDRRDSVVPSVTWRDRTNLAYEAEDDGTPAILLDDAVADRRFTGTTSLAALLARDLSAVPYDRRRRGDSGHTPPYEVEPEVDDVAALLGEFRSPIYGYAPSSGDVLRLTAAARLGERPQRASRDG
jgi:hypothetical protein